MTHVGHKQPTATDVQTQSIGLQPRPLAVLYSDEFSDVSHIIQHLVKQQNSFVVDICDENVSFSVDGEMTRSVELSCGRPGWSTIAAHGVSGRVHDGDTVK